MPDTTNYNAIAGTLLSKGACQPAGQAINAAQTLNNDVLCQGESELVVEVDMTGAANGDLAVLVQPFESDNATVMPISVPAVLAV